ncbi:hypothetical protein BVY04_04035, partial [bacterium M21]
IADLALSRTRIHAPMDGVIMRLHTRVGRKHMIAGDNPDSPTLAEMYDPNHLQVRVDVPLQDAGKLRVGQKAKVKLDLFPDREFSGEVTSLVGIADIQRNTLQAKVRLLQPVAEMRPEMLVRVEFYGSATARTGTAVGGGKKLFIHKDCLQSNADKTATVFVVNPLDQKLEQRAVQLGAAKREDWQEIAAGLNAGEKVVVGTIQGLQPGRRVEPKQEGTQP